MQRDYDTDQAFDPEHTKSQWQRFEAYVNHLNDLAGPTVDYKILYMGRHGEGYHNVAEAFYGTPEWDVSAQKLPQAAQFKVLNICSATGQSSLEMKLPTGLMPSLRLPASTKQKLQTDSGLAKSRLTRFHCLSHTTRRH